MNHLAVIFLVLTLSQGSAQSDQQRLAHYNLKSGLAIEGYDPVSYFSNKPSKGKPGFNWVHGGTTYRFISAENLNAFRSNPAKYEPVYGGWCAYAMGETGEKVKVDPETFKIVDGKLYLFYNFWGNNTLDLWNKNESSLRDQGDRNWRKFIP